MADHDTKATKLDARIERKRVAKKEKTQKGRALVDRLQVEGATVAVNPANLGPNRSVGCPDFLRRGSYVDMPFRCGKCGTSQVWTAYQQKWWYEAVKGDMWAIAVLCRPCRLKKRRRKQMAREMCLAGMAAKKAAK
jgi:hypothetical protein